MLFRFVCYFYSLFFTLALPLIFARLFWRSIRVPAYRKRWLERLGFFTFSSQQQGAIWIHAVSVGEVVAAIPLINSLKNIYPNTPIMVTTTTPTGSQRLMQSLSSRVMHVYMPYDLKWAINNFMRKVKPRGLIIMETELWPNLFNVCTKLKVPVLIVNARISPRSFVNYRKIKFLIEPMLAQVAGIAAQTQADGERFLQLGLTKDKLSIPGNLKFEVQTSEQQKQQGIELKQSFGMRMVWVAASTHPGEEEQVLQAFKQINSQYPGCLLILVPRHPDRFITVAKILEQNNLSYIRRSTREVCKPDTQVMLGDTMGELNLFYAAADLAFVGGSLVKHGGHNLLEPAAMAVPTLTGPYTFNFTEICNKLQQANAVHVVKDPQELAAKVLSWLGDQAERENVGFNALQVIKQNQGAVASLTKLVTNFL